MLAAMRSRQLGRLPDIALGFERHLPFWEWAVIPYMCSGLFFFLAFAWLNKREDLYLFSKRMLLATVAACLVFNAFPLRFSLERPPLNNHWLAPLFQWLEMADQPYNQFPSLHVAYCVIIWASLRLRAGRSWHRWLLGIALATVALSTLPTYQHHLLDLAGGLALGLLCIAWIRPGKRRSPVAFAYALVSGAIFALGVLGMHSLVALYLAASLALVALAYNRQDRYFLHKQNGSHPWWIWSLYAPYLLGYRISWLYVQWHERANPPWRQLGEGKSGAKLWVGRRLNAAQASLLAADCIVIDLAPELAELPALRTANYRHYPLLDIHLPPESTLREIAAAVQAELNAGHCVYLHCAMGYSRCILLANYLELIS
jgi:membrane-associated phospholipid phosphatase